MKRDDKEYVRLRKLMVDLYVDYNLKAPLDIFQLLDKLGIIAIPYSEMNDEMKKLSLKKSKTGYCDNRPGFFKIFYNDDLKIVKSYGRILLTLGHEVKHIVDQDDNDNEENEDYANFFSRYLLCPICYLVAKKYPFDEFRIMKDFRLSQEAAGNAKSAYENYVKKSNGACFKSDKRLLEQLLTAEELKLVKFK